MDAYAKYAAMQAALEAQMRAQGQGAGLRLLRQIMVRMVKGEVAMRVVIWKTATQDVQRMAELKLLQWKLDGRTADGSKGVALRLLRQIMVRMVKGETAMRLEVWRQKVRMAVAAEVVLLRAALKRMGEATSKVSANDIAAIRVLNESMDQSMALSIDRSLRP